MSVPVTLATAIPAGHSAAQQARDDGRRRAEQQPRVAVDGGRPPRPPATTPIILIASRPPPSACTTATSADVAGHVDELGVERALFGEVARRFDVHREVADRAGGHQQHPRDADADGQSDDEEAHARLIYADRSPPTAKVVPRAARVCNTFFMWPHSRAPRESRQLPSTASSRDRGGAAMNRLVQTLRAADRRGWNRDRGRGHRCCCRRSRRSSFSPARTRSRARSRSLRSSNCRASPGGCRGTEG